jgi:hypothetical protein
MAATEVNMIRWIAVCAMSAALMFAPTKSEAQVAEAIMKCSKSLKVAVACVVIDGGVAKVVELGWDKLIELALGRKKKLGPDDLQPSDVTVADVEANGIEWSKLREFLASVYKPATSDDGADVQHKIAVSCRENYQAICRHLGFPEPRTAVDCATFSTKETCSLSISCSWKGATCAKHGGTKELFGR